MSEENEVFDGLISRLTVIDQQPLDRRAVAFAQIHDELRSVLDGTAGAGSSGGSSTSSGATPAPRPGSGDPSRR
jgi:hypothetical protein